MLLLSNHCGNTIQNGRDITANNIPSPIERMIKSISHAMNLSIHLANTIVSVVVVGDDDDDDCDIGFIFLLSSITTMIHAIRIIIPATVRMAPTIIPLNELKLTLLFAPINGRLPANTPMLTGLFPKL